MVASFNDKLYFITPIVNVPSILEHGILSYKRSKSVQHGSVALPPVQERRDKISVPNGLSLHEYANLYFNPRNAMMYKRREMVNEICVIVVSGKVLSIENVVIADMNAAALYARFMPPSELESLDFDAIYAKNWNHDDAEQKDVHKKRMCAEVLVPDAVPPQAIQAIYVGNETAKTTLETSGFPAERTHIKPYLFFL